ncbi:hypothetical protein POZ20_03715, partial [Phocaeicola vulgatus]|nr:hypothetical protein [Phocaeicola vulgatus]
TFAFGLYKGHYTYPMVAQFSTGILAQFSISIYISLLSEGFPRPAGFDLRAGHKADRREIRQGGSG